MWLFVVVAAGVNNSENSNREHIVSTRFSVQYWIPILQFYMNWESKLVLARWLAVCSLSAEHISIVFSLCADVLVYVYRPLFKLLLYLHIFLNALQLYTLFCITFRKKTTLLLSIYNSCSL